MIIPIEKDHLLSKNYEFQACVVSDGEKKNWNKTNQYSLDKRAAWLLLK